MTRASRSRMPASPSPWARKAKLASWVRPDRISLPMIRTQAVTILGAVSLDIISSISLGRGLHRQLHALAQSARFARIAAGRLHAHLRVVAPRLPRLLPDSHYRIIKGSCALCGYDANDSGMQQDVMMGLA